MPVAVRSRKRAVERRFAGIFLSGVDVRPLLDQKLAQPPMAVKRRIVQSEVRPQRRERFAVSEKVPDGAHVAVIGAPLNQPDAVAGGRRGGVPPSQNFPDQVGPAFCDPVEQRVRHPKPSGSNMLVKEERVAVRVDDDKAGRPGGGLVRLGLELHPLRLQLAL